MKKKDFINALAGAILAGPICGFSAEIFWLDSLMFGHHTTIAYVSIAIPVIVYAFLGIVSLITNDVALKEKEKMGVMLVLAIALGGCIITTYFLTNGFTGGENWGDIAEAEAYGYDMTYNTPEEYLPYITIAKVFCYATVFFLIAMPIKYFWQKKH
ncbi:MAG: hypothetical protein IJ545_00300 [Alphaproteobacteria bacterium]|nr:hypothetical protein [Alphaproteobacteria bacterium]